MLILNINMGMNFRKINFIIKLSPCPGRILEILITSNLSILSAIEKDIALGVREKYILYNAQNDSIYCLYVERGEDIL